MTRFALGMAFGGGLIAFGLTIAPDRGAAELAGVLAVVAACAILADKASRMI